MKTFLLSSALVAFSVTSWAGTCPNLVGVYKTCKSSDLPSLFDMKNVSIEEKAPLHFSLSFEAGGSVETHEFLADGKPYEGVEYDPEVGEISYKKTSFCQNNSLVSTTVATILGDFDITETTVLSLNSSNELVIETLLDGEELDKTVCN